MSGPPTPASIVVLWSPIMCSFAVTSVISGTTHIILVEHVVMCSVNEMSVGEGLVPCDV